MSKCHGYIYITIDHFYNKVYIGSKHGEPEESLGYLGSGKIIKNIKKDRILHLEKRVIGVCYSQEELELSEKECVYFYRSFGSDGIHRDTIYGYNLTIDGSGGNGRTMVGRHHSQETKTLISEKQKGENGFWYGKKMSEESNKKRAIANKKRIYKKLGPMSEEQRKLRSEKNKGKIPWNKGIKDKRLGLHQLGKPRTDEEKRKISESSKGKKLTQSHKENIKKGWIKRKQKYPIKEKLVISEEERLRRRLDGNKKRSEALKGRKKTTEHCNSMKKTWAANGVRRQKKSLNI